jgi:hypothetical protein
MLEPVARCFTPAVAKQIAELTAKCNEGQLTETEKREYQAYVEAIDLVGILQAKARANPASLPPS